MLTLFFVITLAWTWAFGFAPVFMGIEGTPLGTFHFWYSHWYRRLPARI